MLYFYIKHLSTDCIVLGHLKEQNIQNGLCNYKIQVFIFPSVFSTLLNYQIKGDNATFQNLFSSLRVAL